LIQNLLQNALVHTPAGTSVDVRVEQSGSQTTLRVRDEGPGLDAEQASRVFDRFYRGTSSGRGSGSGLGLFIVATVAKSLGGGVSVDTAPGKGASFVVVLPRRGMAPDSPNNGPSMPTDPQANSRSMPGVPRSVASSRRSPAPDPIEVHEPDSVHH
jgi:two-component system, OmpR family, sensor kinase